MVSSIIKSILLLSSPLILLLGGIFISFLGFSIYYFHKGCRIKKGESNYKKPSVLKRLFYEFPKRLSLDMYNRDPDEFKEYGLHMFCGEQGSGKTTSVVHLLNKLREKYPKCRVRTNMNYVHQDGEISHWQDLVQNDNGIYGQVEVLDEIQTWFSSNQSKNFPPEMITEISQQRKQRKMLVGTAQIFSRMSKPIREQTTFVYLPLTIFGCLTIVRISKPHFWDDEKQSFKKYIGWYFFVHNEKIRDAFDTYKKIEKYKKVGFKEDSVLQAMHKEV